MALIKCPECNKEISDKAMDCPNCGFPIQEFKKPKFSTTGYNICPKCGYLDDSTHSCPKCNTEMVDCHTTFDEWLTMGVDRMWQWQQEMYNIIMLHIQENHQNLKSPVHIVKVPIQRKSVLLAGLYRLVCSDWVQRR